MTSTTSKSYHRTTHKDGRTDALIAMATLDPQIWTYSWIYSWTCLGLIPGPMPGAIPGAYVCFAHDLCDLTILPPYYTQRWQNGRAAAPSPPPPPPHHHPAPPPLSSLSPPSTTTLSNCTLPTSTIHHRFVPTDFFSSPPSPGPPALAFHFEGAQRVCGLSVLSYTCGFHPRRQGGSGWDSDQVSTPGK